MHFKHIILLIWIFLPGLQVIAQFNVGIGTTNPEEKLHVIGNVRADGGQFRSLGSIALYPDVDTTGDDFVRILNSEGNETARFQDGRFGLNQFFGNISCNIRGVAGDNTVFLTENSSGGDLLRVDASGRMGLNQNYADISCNIRGVTGDNTVFQTENAAGTYLLRVDASGRLGLNQSYSNISCNIKGVAGDNTVLLTENSSGTDLMRLDASGRLGLNQSYGNVSCNIRGVSGDNTIFQAENSIGAELLALDASGRLGLNQAFNDVSCNIRAVAGDNTVFQVEDLAGVDLVSVDEDGRFGLNQSFTNVSCNLRGVSGDFTVFQTENANGTDLLCIDSAGHTGINQLYTNVSCNVRAVPDDVKVFRVENADGSLELFDVDTNGNADIHGMISKGGGTFKIDHPLDPENKYLYHFFVESPDMMNVYNGNIVTDQNGRATVELPDYFEALNKEFRYQLTVIGTFAQAIVKEKVKDNQFVIATSEPNVEVSWQVTGIRQDPFANANRIPNSVDKAPGDKGTYLHPEAYGKSLYRGEKGR